MFYGEPDRFHHAVTGCRTVAGVDIDVSAPEAFWTVVGVAVSCDRDATISAGEIFNVASKSLAHRLVPAFFNLIPIGSTVLGIWLARLHRL